MLAVFSFRYDAHLVPALLSNIEPLVDGWISYDDRHHEALISNEVHRRIQLLSAAREAGADWALAVDPDERFEASLSIAMEDLLSVDDVCAHSFALREMFAVDRYRVDGVWGRKRQARLLSLKRGVRRPEGELHLSWHSFVPEARLNHTMFNLYHLKMIAPIRRAARARLYQHLDPGSLMQRQGYEYLNEDTGAVFEGVPAGREYFPAHIDDGELWMPDIVES